MKNIKTKMLAVTVVPKVTRARKPGSGLRARHLTRGTYRRENRQVHPLKSHPVMATFFIITCDVLSIDRVPMASCVKGMGPLSSQV